MLSAENISIPASAGDAFDWHGRQFGTNGSRNPRPCTVSMRCL